MILGRDSLVLTSWLRGVSEPFMMRLWLLTVAKRVMIPGQIMAALVDCQAYRYGSFQRCSMGRQYEPETSAFPSVCRF